MIPAELHTVYVVIPAGYDEYGILGVYASLEAAQGSVPGQQWTRTRLKGEKRWDSEDAAYLIERWEVTE